MNEDQKAITAVLEGNAFTAYESTDRKKNPTPILVRHMTEDEVKNLMQWGWYEFIDGPKIRRFKVSSIKYRGRGAERHIETIKFKFGLKTYWDLFPETCTKTLIVRL